MTPDCQHEDTWSDGITRTCSDCGEDVAWYDVDRQDWVDGEVPALKHWTEEGWQ